MDLESRVVAVSTSLNKGERKKNVSSARLLEGLGLEGDAHAGFAHRQISLLALESIEKMRQAGLLVNPGDFAENITTVNLNLPALPLGTRLRIGEAVLAVSQIGKKCHNRCAIYYQAGDCIMPTEGIFAVVLRGGVIKTGDAVAVVV